MIPANYPLLSLSRGKTLSDFIEICLHQGYLEELQFALDVGLVNDPEPLWEKLVEVRQMQIQVKEETWQSINEFLRLTPEAFEKLPLFRDAIDQAEDDGVEQGIERGIEQGILAQRQTLLQLLHFLEQLLTTL